MPLDAAAVRAWDTAHWEFSLVFEGLADEDVWRRAHPGLLSIGELACHTAYWEAEVARGVNPQAAIQSPLVDARARYYSTHQPFSLPLGAAETAAELKRVHEAARDAMDAEGIDPAMALPDDPGFSLAARVEYFGFHVAYHAGQAYSVRHLMGHQTTDN
jgi:hypothetical protein